MTTQFEIPDLALARLLAVIENKSDYRKAFSVNMTRALVQDLDYRKRHKMNFISQTYGDTGTAKSWSMIKLAKKRLSPDTFNIKYIFFTYREALDYLKNVKVGDTILIDEQSRQFGIGTFRILAEFRNLTEQVRGMQVNILLLSPVLRETGVCHYLFQTFYSQIDYKTQDARLAILDSHRNVLGYVVIKSPEVDYPNLIKAYEKKKKAYLETLTHKGKKSWFTEKAMEVMKSDTFKHLALVNKKTTKEGNEIYKLSFNKIVAYIDDLYPELQNNIETAEIANKIKLYMDLGKLHEIMNK